MERIAKYGVVFWHGHIVMGDIRHSRQKVQFVTIDSSLGMDPLSLIFGGFKDDEGEHSVICGSREFLEAIGVHPKAEPAE